MDKFLIVIITLLTVIGIPLVCIFKKDIRKFKMSISLPFKFLFEWDRVEKSEKQVHTDNESTS